MKKSRLQELVKELTRSYDPGTIQGELAREYENLSHYSKTEAEFEFWTKCARASKNLSSGMIKWAGNMIDELEGEESETEGG